MVENWFNSQRDAFGHVTTSLGTASPRRPSRRCHARQRQSANEARKETAPKLLSKDAITVVLVGTGSPLPSERAQASTAVFVNGRFLLFDCGDGASRSIQTHQSADRPNRGRVSHALSLRPLCRPGRDHRPQLDSGPSPGARRVRPQRRCRSARWLPAGVSSGARLSHGDITARR